MPIAHSCPYNPEWQETQGLLAAWSRWFHWAPAPTPSPVSPAGRCAVAPGPKRGSPLSSGAPPRVAESPDTLWSPTKGRGVTRWDGGVGSSEKGLHPIGLYP